MSAAPAVRADVGALIEAIQSLSMARDAESVQAIVRSAARRLTRADGATIVRRDGDHCSYVDEDAITPLWKGQRFPMSACVSGIAMRDRETVVMPDIYADARVPHDAYRPTFVRSLAMVPIRTADPLGAIGVYWARSHRPSPHDVEVLEALANSTAVAFENILVRDDLERRVAARTAELAATNARLEALSSTDELTGALNRRGFLILGAEALTRATEGSASLAFIDVDGLKQVNDQLGHEAGDALLRRVAIGLRRAVRDDDLVARLSGDEFAVMVVDSGRTTGLLAERLQSALSAETAADGPPLRASIGVVEVDRDQVGASLEQLLALADARMYTAKGRRRAA